MEMRITAPVPSGLSRTIAYCCLSGSYSELALMTFDTWWQLQTLRELFPNELYKQPNGWKIAVNAVSLFFWDWAMYQDSLPILCFKFYWQSTSEGNVLKGRSGETEESSWVTSTMSWTYLYLWYSISSARNSSPPLFGPRYSAYSTLGPMLVS